MKTYTARAVEMITQKLKQRGTMEIGALDDYMDGLGFCKSTTRRAKESMTKNDLIRRYCTGYGPTKRWYIELKEGK